MARKLNELVIFHLSPLTLRPFIYFSIILLVALNVPGLALAGNSISIGGIHQSGSGNSIIIGGSGSSSSSGVEGSGKSVKLNRSLPKFSKIFSDLSAEILFQAAPRFEVILQGDDNILPLISTQVKDNQLVLTASGDYMSRNDLKITVFAPFITRFEGVGSGDVRLQELRTETLELLMSGSGDMEANGTVAELNVRLNGSGDLNLADLQAKKCSLALEGSGDISVFASSQFKGEIAGSGDVSIHGKPAKITQSVTGSGEFVFE